MYCPNCGKKIPEGANFCGACGTKLLKASQMQPDRPDQTEEDASPQETKGFAQSISGMFLRRKKAVFGVSVGVAACLVLAVGVYGRQTSFEGLSQDGLGTGRFSFLGEREYSESVASLDSLIEVEEKEAENEIEEIPEESEIAPTEENAVAEDVTSESVSTETKAAAAETKTEASKTEAAATEEKAAAEETEIAAAETETVATEDPAAKKGTSAEITTSKDNTESSVSVPAIDENMAQGFLDTFSGSLFALLEDWYDNGSTFDYENLDNGQAYSIAALSLIEQEEDIYGSGVTTYCCLNNVLYPIQEDTEQAGLDEASSDTIRFASNTMLLASALYLSDVSIVSEESEQDEDSTISVADLNQYLEGLAEKEESEEVKAAEEVEIAWRSLEPLIIGIPGETEITEKTEKTEEAEEEPLLSVYDIGDGKYRVDISVDLDETESDTLTFSSDSYIISEEDEDLELYILLDEEQLQKYTEVLETLFAEEYPLDEFVEFESESYGSLIRKPEESVEQYYLKIISEDDPVRSEEVTVDVDEIAEEPDAEGAYTVTMTYRSRKSKREYQMQCSLVPDETAPNGCRLSEEGFTISEKTSEEKAESDAEKEELEAEQEVNQEEKPVPEERIEAESILPGDTEESESDPDDE